MLPKQSQIVKQNNSIVQAKQNTQMTQTQISNSVEQTINIAQNFAQTLCGGETILLQGDLGAGKTHFVKGLALGLNITDLITSPTFTLHNIYYGKLTLNHFDFYRVDSAEEVEMLGLNEFFSTDDGVSAIEWSQNVAELLPKQTITVTINKIDDNSREIIINR